MSLHRDINGHRGRFLLDAEMLAPGWSYLHAHRMQHILSYMIITKCGYNPVTNSLEYLAYSWLFKELPDGIEAPWYSIVVSEGGYKIEAVMQ